MLKESNILKSSNRESLNSLGTNELQISKLYLQENRKSKEQGLIERVKSKALNKLQVISQEKGEDEPPETQS
jgi:hypothetical protein